MGLLDVVHHTPDVDSAIYERLYTPLYRYVYVRLRDSALAEDFVHDVFTNTFERKPAFESEDHERRYLFTAVRNRMIDHLRKKKELLLDEEFAQTIPSSEDTATLAYDREAREKIAELISRLPEDQYTAISLKYIEGMSNQDIAETMDKSEEAVRQLQSRGLRTLRTHTQNNHDQ